MTQENRNQFRGRCAHFTEANKQRHRCPVAALKAESAHKRKKGRGGPRNSLISLDSAKEIKGFSLQKFGQILLDEARIWLDVRREIGEE
jgi:hypothetical protein